MCCYGGSIEEADSIIKDTEKGAFIWDVNLILAAEKVEHYEITTYRTFIVLRNKGYDKVVNLLQ